MRALMLVCFFICCGGGARSQEAPAFAGPPGVTVVKHGWSKERIDWEGVPPAGSYSSSDVRGPLDMRGQVAAQDRAVKSRPPRPRYAFLYKATFRNGEAKAIKSITWDYVFLDAETGEEVGRRRFTSVRAIAPRERREVSHYIASPPTHKISVYALGKRERDGLRERVTVVQVSYADGTMWRGGGPADAPARGQ